MNELEKLFAEKKTENGDKPLRGIPDITVIAETKDYGRKITLIDLKNKIRSSGTNSDEIYKVMGYYTNFADFLKKEYPQSTQRKGMLLYRNDVSSFSEKLESKDGERIFTYSVSPEDDANVNQNQFIKICSEIVN